MTDTGCNCRRCRAARMCRRLEQLEARIASLFDAIKHGDDEHRQWLQEAITAHFNGQSVPAPRGKGQKEAKLEQYEKVLREIADWPDALGSTLSSIAVKALREIPKHTTNPVVLQIAREALSQADSAKEEKGE